MRCTGSSQNAAAPISSVQPALVASARPVPARCPPGQPTALTVTQIANSAATVLTASDKYSNVRNGSTVAEMKTIAANGVYVNFRLPSPGQSYSGACAAMKPPRR